MNSSSGDSGRIENEKDDWLVPPLPGVEQPAPEEDWGTLSHDPDEESEDDALEGIAAEVKHTLGSIGIDGVNRTSKDEIISFWGDMDMDSHLIFDLALFTINDKRKFSQDNFKTASFKDLTDVTRSLSNPYEVRGHLIEEIAPALIRLGYKSFDAYRLPRRDGNLGKAWRAEGWLAGQPYMGDLHTILMSAIKSKSGAGLKISGRDVLRITIEEIERQARILSSKKVIGEYDQSISYKAEAYEQYKKSLRSAYNVGLIALKPLI